MILISTIGALMKEGTLLKTKEIDTFYKGQAVVIAKIEEVLDGAMIVSFAIVATSNKRGLNEKQT